MKASIYRIWCDELDRFYNDETNIGFFTTIEACEKALKELKTVYWLKHKTLKIVEFSFKGVKDVPNRS